MRTKTVSPLIAFLLLASVVSANLFGRKQRVIVKGVLMCGAKPAKDVTVKLIDEDDGGVDDKMDEKKTNANGEFTLDGEESELTNIDPQINVYHDCNDNLPCQRKWKVKIPDKYINTNKPIDIGTWNLEVIIPNESRDCIH